MAPDHTIFNLCKYRDNASTKYRILGAKQYNGLFGWSWGCAGVAFEGDAYISDTYNTCLDDPTLTEFPIDEWLLSTTCTDLYRGNGEDLTKPGVKGTVVPSNVGIPDQAGQFSDWACSEIIIVNERLSTGEIECVEWYFSSKYDLRLTALGCANEPD
eukprot:317880_1